MSSPPRFLTIAIAFSAVFVLTSLQAAAGNPRPIKKLSVDPDAEKVEMFAGIKNGSLEVKLIQKNSLKGNMLVTNKTDKPLTVQLPDAFVGVQVLKQNFFNNQQNQQSGNGNGLGNQGGAQSTGGGSQQGNQQQSGFFSVPPKKTVLVPYNSVCLEHGKAEPRVRMDYRPVPVTKFSDDVVLHSLLKLVAGGRIDPKAAQAAAWHLADDMNWKQLTAKQVKHLGGRPPTQYFTARQIRKAKQLVDQAVIAAKEQKPKSSAPAANPKRDNSIVRVSRKN